MQPPSPTRPRLFGPQRARHVGSGQGDDLAAVRADAESHIHDFRPCRMAGNIVWGEAATDAFHRGQAVQGPAVEQVPSGMAGDRPCNGAFTGPARAVDRDDGDCWHTF